MESEFQVQNIALKTLKQRCEYLQQRLIDVEEENCKLKLEKAQQFTSVSPKIASSNNSLEEQIIILQKEKSQLAHQIEIITTENLNLWSQLSKCIPGSDITAKNLSFSPITNSQQVFKFNHSANTTHTDSLTDDFSKESLEEISLKLINGILMGKNELENQYSQMIDLQRENNTDEINLILQKQCDSRAAVKNVRDYIQKLKDFKQVLNQQKSDLKNAIIVMKNFENMSNNARHSNNNSGYTDEINEAGSEFSTSQEGKALNREQSSGQYICPMCGKNFTRFSNIYGHCLHEHFDVQPDDDDEFVDASSNFEQ